MKIHVDLKSNSDNNFHRVFVYDIPTIDYNVLKNYDDELYDEVWDRLCERIENETVPTLDPDWYIDGIDFKEENR